jgi:NAD(P)-dependent dehydrogenase (short-subunit alcohol dehydrogenase family)
MKRVVVITGAARGIGRAMAECFRAAGDTVIEANRSVGCDVSREAAVERLFAGLGEVDILINNASILTPRRPVTEITVVEWDETMAVNLRGVFLCTRAALRKMLPRGRGLIVNMSSGVGKRLAPGWGAYAVSKWGVEGFTMNVAEEVKTSGVKVVAVNPGGTRTAMRAAAFPAEDPATLKRPEAVAEFVLRIADGKISFQTGDSLDYS